MRRFKNELIDLDMQISPRFQGFLSALLYRCLDAPCNLTI